MTARTRYLSGKAPKYHMQDGHGADSICGATPKQRYLRRDVHRIDCQRCLDKIKGGEA